METNFGTASLIEIAWTLLAAIGALYHMRGVHDAGGDLSFLKRAGLNGRRRVVALRNLRSEITRLFVKTIFFGVGVVALVTPPPERTSNTTASLIAGVGLVLALLALTFDSFLERQDRETLLAMEHEQGADHHSRDDNVPGTHEVSHA